SALLRQRAVRIFSLYWPARALGCIALPAVAWNLLAKDWPDIITSIFLLGSDWRLAFASYPHDHWEALPLAFGPAWSLGAELTFYLMAPFIVRRTFVVIAIMLGSLAIRFWFVWQYGAQIQETWTLHFFGSTVCSPRLSAVAPACAVPRRPQQRLPPSPVPPDRDGTVRSTKRWGMLPIDRLRPRRYGPRAKRPAADGA